MTILLIFPSDPAGFLLCSNPSLFEFQVHNSKNSSAKKKKKNLMSFQTVLMEFSYIEHKMIYLADCSSCFFLYNELSLMGTWAVKLQK